MIMQHSFDTDIAVKYGVHSAILFNHISFWIAKNEANGVNFYDGNYWTYNSREAFSKLFPYMTARQISYALDKLIEAGLIETGNYNNSAYDRTLWYAITDKGKSILQNCQMETQKMLNQNDENVKPIPYKKTDKKPYKKTDIKEIALNWLSNKKDLFISEEEKESFISSVTAFAEMREEIKKKLTARALDLILEKVYKLAGGNLNTASDILNQSVMNGWQGVFPLKKESGAVAPVKVAQENITEYPF